MIPPKSHPAYKALVVGVADPKVQSLALKMVLGRLRLAAKKDSSSQNVQRQVDSLFEFFEKNPRIATLDVEALFGKTAA